MTQDPEVGERSWKDGLSVRHLLPPASGPVCVDQWTGEPTAAIASTQDDDGVLPLVYAAACAHSSSFSSLLPLTPTGELQDFLTSVGTSLLHFILEAPLRPSSFDQSEEVRESEIPADRDSDSLACLQTLWNYSRLKLSVLIFEGSVYSNSPPVGLSSWSSWRNHLIVARLFWSWQSGTANPRLARLPVWHGRFSFLLSPPPPPPPVCSLPHLHCWCVSTCCRGHLGGPI